MSSLDPKQKLSKEHGSKSIRQYREEGYSAARLAGLLAYELGLSPLRRELSFDNGLISSSLGLNHTTKGAPNK